MGTITRDKIIRDDLYLYDGVSRTASRTDASGSAVSGLSLGDEIDVLQVYGDGSDRTVATINKAITAVGSSNRMFLFSTGTWTIDSSVTIPSNVNVHIAAGCVFNISSSVTLTISGKVFADHDAWESGSGTALAADALHQWVNLGHNPTRGSDTTFTIPSDVTGIYETGRRIKVVGDTTGYGRVDSSSYSAPDTTVTVTWDSGTTPTTPAQVYVSILSISNKAYPGTELGNAVETKTDDYTVTTSDDGKIFVMNATDKTLTLPAASSAGDGFRIGFILIDASGMTIAPNGSDTINGSNGTFYVSHDSGGVLYCDGSDWFGPITDPQWITKVKTADETVNNSTTFQDDDDFTGFNLIAGARYEFEMVVVMDNTSSHGCKMQFVFSQTPQYLYASGTIIDNAGNLSSDEVYADGQAFLFTRSVQPDAGVIKGIFQANATTGGTLKVQWAQQTAAVADLKWREGSVMKIRLLQ